MNLSLNTDHHHMAIIITTVFIFYNSLLTILLPYHEEQKGVGPFKTIETRDIMLVFKQRTTNAQIRLCGGADFFYCSHG